MMFIGGGLLNPHINLPSDLFSFSHIRNTTRMENSRIGALRTVSSSRQGMRATVDEQVNWWQEQDNDGDDPEKTAGVGPHQRIGIGLPMSNIFATSAFYHISVWTAFLRSMQQLFWRITGACIFRWLGCVFILNPA